jgi:hypothetical protein
MAETKQILSPSDGKTPQGEKIPTTSERALAEFKYACSVWLPCLSPTDLHAAVEHAKAYAANV